MATTRSRTPPAFSTPRMLQQKVFQVGHNRRFAPVYKRLKELLIESPPHTAHIKMNRGELLKPAWTGDDSVTGGFLYETPIHMFDMMRFQFGEIASLDARLSGPNDFSMLVEFVSGMYATFVTSADTGWFFPYERVEVFGRTRPSKPPKSNRSVIAWDWMRKPSRKTFGPSRWRRASASKRRTACL